MLVITKILCYWFEGIACAETIDGQCKQAVEIQNSLDGQFNQAVKIHSCFDGQFKQAVEFQSCLDCQFKFMQVVLVQSCFPVVFEEFMSCRKRLVSCWDLNLFRHVDGDRLIVNNKTLDLQLWFVQFSFCCSCVLVVSVFK